MAKEKKIAYIESYKREGKVVSGHDRTVTVNNDKDIRNKKRSENLQHGIKQYAKTSEVGASFVRLDDESAEGFSNFYPIGGGRYVGVSKEVAKAERDYERAESEFRHNQSKATLNKRDAARTQFRVALAGDEKSYIFSEVHIRDEAIYKICPPTSIETENYELKSRVMELQRRKGVTLLEEPPPYEMYMRLKLKERLRTKQEAAHYLNPTGSDAEIEKTIKSFEKPGILQNLVSRAENRKLKKILKSLSANSVGDNGRLF